MSECKHETPTIEAINDGALTVSYCEDCNKTLWEIKAEELEVENTRLRDRETELQKAVKREEDKVASQRSRRLKAEAKVEELEE
jgi:hypothetical protein